MFLSIEVHRFTIPPIAYKDSNFSLYLPPSVILLFLKNSSHPHRYEVVLIGISLTISESSEFFHVSLLFV